MHEAPAVAEEYQASLTPEVQDTMITASHHFPLALAVTARSHGKGGIDIDV